MAQFCRYRTSPRSQCASPPDAPNDFAATWFDGNSRLRGACGAPASLAVSPAVPFSRQGFPPRKALPITPIPIAPASTNMAPATQFLPRSVEDLQILLIFKPADIMILNRQL